MPIPFQFDSTGKLEPGRFTFTSVKYSGNGTIWRLSKMYKENKRIESFAIETKIRFEFEVKTNTNLWFVALLSLKWKRKKKQRKEEMYEEQKYWIVARNHYSKALQRNF